MRALIDKKEDEEEAALDVMYLELLEGYIE